MQRKKNKKKPTRNPIAGILRAIGKPKRVAVKREKLLRRAMDREVYG